MSDIFNTPIYVCDLTMQDDSVIRYHFSNKDVMALFAKIAETRKDVKRTLCDNLGYMIFGNSITALESLDYWIKAKKKD